MLMLNKHYIKMLKIHYIKNSMLLVLAL